MTKHWAVLVTASLATLLAIFALTPLARADIYQWEYINPANPGEGKQPSSTLALDGAGVNAVPGTNLSSRNLTKAYLIGVDLTGAWVSAGNLTNAELSQANLTNANFGSATLTGANLTGAEVRGADFLGIIYGGTGITPSQLYSTASYQAHDLSGTSFDHNEWTGANLAGQNLVNCTFHGAVLNGANLSQSDLTNADLTGALLTNANFSQANLTNAQLGEIADANFTGAEVRGANFVNFGGSAGITAAQLYSTASYQAHDLTGIKLAGNNLAGVNLVGQNLSNAYFTNATLTGTNFSQANLTNANFEGVILMGANLTGAEVRGATFSYNQVGGLNAAQLYSTASYQAHDLTGIGLQSVNLTAANLAGQNLTNAWLFGATLTNANLSQANLRNANFGGATLTDANFTGAEVRGADFAFYPSIGGTGITAAQLYSTASYQAHDLTGIKLYSNNLAGVNLAGQNLTGANFRFATLSNANFSHANLTGADFSGYDEPIYDEDGNQIGTNSIPGAYLYGTNLSGADARGANFYLAWLGGANTTNLIQSDGHIAGVDLTAGASLIVRDYDGNLPISVDQHLAMDATGTLRLVFDADPWDSTISFAPGIPVTRGGTLELAFAPGVNVAAQSGRTIDLFDWTGVTPTGTFTVSSPYTWNLTNLYTTGEVTLATAPSLPGDFNSDGTVDAADYVVWRKTGGTAVNFNTWRSHFGQPSGSGSVADANATVPEPASLVLCVSSFWAIGTFALRKPWRDHRHFPHRVRNIV